MFVARVCAVGCRDPQTGRTPCVPAALAGRTRLRLVGAERLPDRVVCDLAQRFGRPCTEAGGEGTECRIGDMALRFRRAWRELPSTERATELCCSRREPTGSRAPVLHYVRGRE